MTEPAVAATDMPEVRIVCWPDGIAILTTLLFCLTETGIVVPGLMPVDMNGVLTVTTWVFGLVDGCKKVDKVKPHRAKID